LKTRDYMGARYAHIESLQKANTFEAVEAAANHCLDMHRLNRGDNQGIRYLTPHVLIRIGKDQEAYDFMMWWSTTGQKSNYNWADTKVPFLDVKNADVFEDPSGIFLRKYSDSSHAIAVALIKLRLLIDLRALQNSNMMRCKLPQEVIDRVREQLVSNPVRNNREILHSADLTPQITKLEAQVDQCYEFVNRENKYFWPALLNPEPYLGHSRGDKGEMLLYLNYSYAAWDETPGAIDAIRKKMAGVM